MCEVYFARKVFAPYRHIYIDIWLARVTVVLLNKRALVCYEDNYGRSKRHWVVK